MPHSLSISPSPFYFPCSHVHTPDFVRIQNVSPPKSPSVAPLCSHCLFYPSLTLLVHDTCSVSSWPSFLSNQYLPSFTASVSFGAVIPTILPTSQTCLLHLPFTVPSWLLSVGPWLMRAARDVWYFGRLVHAMFMATDLNRLCLAVLVSHKLAPLDDCSPNLPTLWSSKPPSLENPSQRR